MLQHLFLFLFSLRLFLIKPLDEQNLCGILPPYLLRGVVILTTVTLYTAPNCPACEKVKTFLTNHHVNFTSINITENRGVVQNIINNTRQRSVPVVHVHTSECDYWIVGYDSKRLTAALDDAGLI